MATNIFIKRSSVKGKAPTTSDLAAGELGLNMRDAKLFAANSSAVFEIGSNVSSASIGSLTIGNGSPYTLPTSDGSSGQVLTAHGNGTLTFAAAAAAAGTNNTIDSFLFTPMANQTIFTGTANVGGTLGYTNTFSEVYLNGVKLIFGRDYSTPNTTHFILTSNAVSGDTVELVGYNGTYAAIPSTYYNSFTFTSNTDQTQFNGTDDNGKTLNYSLTATDVYLNGVKQVKGVDWFANTISKITLSVGTANNDVLEAVTFNGISSPSEYLQVANATSTFVPLSNSSFGQFSGRRNILYNGAMKVAQRGNSSTGWSNQAGYPCADRWYIYSGGSGTFTYELVADGPAGFAASFKATTTTADASLDANDTVYIQQYLEGIDVQHLAYGTASAKSLTVSFWIKSSLTGNVAVGLYAANAPANIGTTVTINSANTWEYKTVTFPGNTSNAISNVVTEGLRLWIAMCAGSTFTTTDNTSWGTYSSARAFYGQTLNLQGTLNATFQLAGLQMEIGSVATSFEQRSYGDELELCKRYYYRSTHQSILNGYAPLNEYLYLSHDLPVTMRTTPSVTLTYVGAGGSIGTAAAPTVATGSRSPTGFYVYKQATLGPGQGYTIYYHTSDAEL